MEYLVFSSDKSRYDAFLEKTIPHKKGYFVLAPSGTGKTYFIKNLQKENHWIDGDTLWQSTGAHPDSAWWSQGLDVIKQVDARSDVVTAQAKECGLWVLGASNNWLRPDAIVLPDWKTNVRYIKTREKNNYDGGLKSDGLAQLKSHRKELRMIARTKNVPIFPTVQAATEYILGLEKQS